LRLKAFCYRFATIFAAAGRASDFSPIVLDLHNPLCIAVIGDLGVFTLQFSGFSCP
jgi:hypothetical protein